MKRSPAPIFLVERTGSSTNLFILLNVAVGGTFPGSQISATQFPQDMLVDYVRVYSNLDRPCAGYQSGWRR